MAKTSETPAKTCGAQYVLKDCQCLADPFDRYSTLCGYISKEDGLLYGCDTGCCPEKCDNLNKIPMGLENRPSAGVTLPPGYGVNLQTSNEPTPTTKGEAPFSTQSPPRLPVWQVLLIAIIPLILVLFLSCFI